MTQETIIVSRKLVSRN